jgi:hypothetical protein
MLALPSTFGIENIPPGAILQDIVPVNPRSRPVVLADRSSDNTSMDELRDIGVSDILNEFNDNTAQVQNRQTNIKYHIMFSKNSQNFHKNNKLFSKPWKECLKNTSNFLKYIKSTIIY